MKGHSADGGNDRADTLVQWGKEAGPYARLRNSGGEGESRYGAAKRWAALQQIEIGLEDPRPVGEDERGTDAAIEAFEFLARLGRECVSNFRRIP